MQREPVAAVDTRRTRAALDEPAAAVEQLDDQRVQKRYRVELRLVRQPHTAVVRERHVGVVVPLRVQAHRLARLQLGARRRHALAGLRIGVGVFALHRDPVRLAAVQQPLLTLAVSVDVGLRRLDAVPLDDLGQSACPATG